MFANKYNRHPIAQHSLTIYDVFKSVESGVCRRHILTSKVDPRTVRGKKKKKKKTHNIGIQMKQKELLFPQRAGALKGAVL